jgi:hypothetical protein
MTHQAIEDSLKTEIESYFLSIYPEDHLYSHGLGHHRRVWQYAKEILYGINHQYRDWNSILFENLMIACYFHDIGMAINQDPGHGTTSKNECIKFLENRRSKLTEFQEALSAIENHDNKEYNTTQNGNIILRILSIADDLDAFGFIGIYRYSDIYLRRQIDPKNIGTAILKNATARYDNFIRTGELNSDLFIRHRLRFEILESFFIDYNKQLTDYKFTNTEISGYCGIVQLFSSMIGQQCKPDFSNIFSKYSNDPVITWYSEGLLSELNSTDHPTQ